MNNVKLTREALVKNSWPLKEVGGLSLHMSPLLMQEESLVHAFTTRLGGESQTPLDSFNLGRHVDNAEQRADAMRNRERLCNALGVDFSRLKVPGQVHSSKVVPADSESFAEVDGVATHDTTPILLHFADCVPVIIFERKLRAVCVVHAGWKGTAGAIARNGVKFLVERYGGRPENMVAAVGPAVGTCCYPTGQEVIEALTKTVSTTEGLIEHRQGKPHPDLRAFNALQLFESGVAKVDVTDLCTACHPHLFYSHRQSGGKTGRQGALACVAES